MPTRTPGLPQNVGLYDRSFERDACGIGLIADLSAAPTRSLLDRALAGAARVDHRGAVAADGVTGDGSGIHTHIPRALLHDDAERLAGRSVDETEPIGIGMLFLPRDRALREAAEQITERELRRAGAEPAGWRDVPIDERVLGVRARSLAPVIRQVVALARLGENDGDVFERRLYLARRRIQKAASAAGCEPFHVCSLSARTVVYKGLIVTTRLADFYADLADDRFRTAVALFHQRFSTNTFPTWFLAQPFRRIAHNGEFNTLRGNIEWMRAREPGLRTERFGEDVRDLLPIVNPADSDSATFDRLLELLVMGGRDPLRALSMLMPPPHAHAPRTEPAVRAMVEYHADVIEPWDGPAAVVYSDGNIAAAALDRNGLRPLRYWRTTGGLVAVGSESGLLDVPAAQIAETGKLGPGEQIAVDFQARALLRDGQIKARLAAEHPYADWLAAGVVEAPAHPGGAPARVGAGEHAADEAETLAPLQRAFGYGKEDIERILGPMARSGQPPIGSMGDDTPLAALSAKPQLAYRYFKQRFAQVTNPPIDPIRERVNMSLATTLGRHANVLADHADAARYVRFQSPVIGEADLAWLTRRPLASERPCTLPCRFDAALGPAALGAAIDGLEHAALDAARAGCTVLVLSDRGLSPTRAPLPMLLSVAAVHHALIEAGLRLRVSLVCDTGEARDDHQVACLIGFGATLVLPWLALETIRTLAAPGAERDAASAYRAALDAGLLKIMSKMGVTAVQSYRGAGLFECLGLGREIVNRWFPGVTARAPGVGLEDIAADTLTLHADAFGEHPKLTELGIYRFRRGGEHHAFNPTVFKTLHKAVRTESLETFLEYAAAADEQPASTIRDLLAWSASGEAIDLAEVEPVERIVARFSTQAMSHGALSREAHEVMSVAMNRLGGKSNSGEGGEDAERFVPYTVERRPSFHGAWSPKEGDLGNSAIKQIATGRFGVTPAYLVSAREIEIKMAQGAKPGEGGQIPGFKVTAEIAGLRRASPGTTLISPPPHHDIYSIEDLEQLIYDLKRVNPSARVAVKLVSTSGVGTIAAGVAKAYADIIQISGHDGGTGAAPLSSIKHAGLPWELGLAETHQTLSLNGLRRRVTLRVDGGMRTGRDVVLAALLGADEVGFGTAALIAGGCVMARQCHANTCPVGIATQRPELRAKFPGAPEHVVAFMTYVAQQVRMILAGIGARGLAELVGRTDLLRRRDAAAAGKGAVLDLSRLLLPVAPPDDEHPPDPAVSSDPRIAALPAAGEERARNVRPEPATPLDQRLADDCAEAVEHTLRTERTYAICNRDRSVGARLAGLIAGRHGDAGLADGAITIGFDGVSGQSFGAFCTRGMTLVLRGEAQDYLGKSMHGGVIVVRPPREASYAPEENCIAGNTILYGATGGRVFLSGRTGERLAVRNSGATVVAEGCGDHGCEYMTGGTVVLLGPVGRNFAAGMSGGRAFVHDPGGELPEHVNHEMVDVRALDPQALEAGELRELIAQHRANTCSPAASRLLEDWAESVRAFRVVAPREVALAEEEAPEDSRAGERVA